MTHAVTPADMKRVRLTALAEFVPHFPFSIYYDVEGDDAIVHAVLDDRFGPARIAAHFGPLER